MTFQRIAYKELNSRQQENYNFHQLAAVLVDYGFTTLMRLSDDWKGADLIAQHKDGRLELRIQLKSRLYFGKKYLGKGLYVAFREGEKWYLYPHDELFQEVAAISKIEESESWKRDGEYHFPSISANIRAVLEKYTLNVDGK